MDSSILQNPADPDATYREKAGKQNRGYTANVTECSGDEGSIVTDYQYEQNTYSDQQFMKDTLDNMEKQDTAVTIVTDGAYISEEIQQAATEKNVELISTNLTGKAAEDLMADFEFDTEGTRVLRCPNGEEPKSCSYNPKTGQCTVSFHKGHCENCPYKEQCHPKMFKRTSRKTLFIRSKHRAVQWLP